MRILVALVLTALSTLAFAQQPQITAKFDMPWSLTSVEQIDALRGPSATGVWSAVPLQSAKIDLNIDAATLAASPLGINRLIAFPGQPSAWTITALRLTVCAGGTFVCEQPMKLRQAVGPYKVRAGHPVIVSVKLALPPAKQGDMTMAEDALTSSGTITPPPVVVPPPVVTPPAGFVTADGTWTLTAPDPNCEGGIKTVVKLNGMSKGAADEIRVCAGTLYARDGATWYTGSAASTCGGNGWTRGTPPC
jgi:hypothetical protein